MHYIIANRWPRYDSEERWDNELTRYESFIDHKKNQVSYVVDAAGRKGILTPDEDVAAVEEIKDINDVAELTAACRRIAERVGPVDGLIALSEFNLEVAALVRQELEIPGPLPEAVAVYRDKVRMKDRIHAAGLRAPVYFPCEDNPDILQKAEELGYPLILKPRSGAASMGVMKIENRQELITALDSLELKDKQIEEFVEGPIYHIDGVTDPEGRVVFMVVSRYINDCLSFAQGAALGSVTVEPSDLRTRIEEFSVQCCEALEIKSCPFHLEVILKDGQPVFLELGARVGGSEVPHLINHLFGVNLYEYSLRTLSGERPPVPDIERVSMGGWLVFPKPETERKRVLAASSFRDAMPSVWRELLPKSGDILEPGGAYDSLHCGRFILKGETEEQVESDIRRIIEGFSCEMEPV